MSRPVYDVIVNRLSLRAAPVLLLLTFVMPPDGLPITLCWVHAATGLPCPGCGLTRSLASISHGHLGAALRYHPFGLVIYALFAALTAASLAGEARRARLRAWLERSALAARSRTIYHGVLAAFLAFGLLRFGLALLLTMGALPANPGGLANEPWTPGSGLSDGALFPGI